MNKGVSEETPDLSLPNLRAVEHRIVQDCAIADRKNEGGHDRTNDMHADEDRGDINRVTSNPRYRPIIIGGSHSEHISSKQPALRMRKADRLCLAFAPKECGVAF